MQGIFEKSRNIQKLSRFELTKTIERIGKMKIKNASELTSFIGKALPWAKDTGKVKHLRKIESDPKSKGKGVIIWYGCPSASSITKLRVTVNLGVHPFGFVADPSIIRETENELKIAFVCMYGNKQVKQEKTIEIPAKAVEVVETVGVM